MDVVAAVEAVGTPSGRPTAPVVIEKCGLELEDGGAESMEGAKEAFERF